MGDHAVEGGLPLRILFETRESLADLEKEVRERDHGRKGDIQGLGKRLTETEKNFAVVLEKVGTMETAFGAMRTALYGAAVAVVVAAVSVILFTHG